MTVLFVIATIILFLSIDWLVRKTKEQPSAIPQPSPASIAKTYPIRIPEGIFFAPSHTWLNLYPSGKVRLGVDDFISRLVETPEIVLLKNPGEKIQKGDPLILLKEGGHFLTIRSPLAGDVLAINEELTSNPALLKERLFSDGWGYVIKPSKLGEIKRMLIGNETHAWIRNEFQRLRDFFAGMSKNGALEPAFLQDGGPPIAGVLRTMDDAVWQHLDHEFLQAQ
jgi:glycine cleavage system H protein